MSQAIDSFAADFESLQPQLRRVLKREPPSLYDVPIPNDRLLGEVLQLRQPCIPEWVDRQITWALEYAVRKNDVVHFAIVAAAATASLRRLGPQYAATLGDTPLAVVQRATVLLMVAARDGHDVMLEWLLTAREQGGWGVDPNLRDEHSMALNTACVGGSTSSVRCLLAFGAEAFPPAAASPQYGITPLSEAVLYGHTEVVQLLLDHFLARGTRAQVAQALDHQDWRGCTALHTAAAKRFFAVARMLLAAGGSPLIRNRDGRTPVEGSNVGKLLEVGS